MGFVQLTNILDYFKTTAPSARHRELFNEYLARTKGSMEPKKLDVQAFEASLFSDTEANIAKGLKLNAKFKCPDFVDEFELKSTILSKNTVVSCGTDTLVGERSVPVSFTGHGEISLICNPNDFVSPASGTLIYYDDATIRAKMESAFRDLSSEECKDSLMVSVAEKMSMGNDVRSMMLKGYLYLCDLVVHSSAGGLDVMATPEDVPTAQDPSDKDLLALMDSVDVVINSDGLDDAELALAGMLCCSYPRLLFGGESMTIYNQLNVGPEKAVIVLKGDRDMSVAFDWTAPDFFWSTLLRLACKLDAVKQLHDVIADFRGIPYLLDNIVKYSPDQNSFYMAYPRSRCLTRAMGGPDECSTRIVNPSNYLSTNLSVICDNLVGQALVSGIFTYGEYIGVFGEFGCPSGKIEGDVVVYSRHCDHGLDCENYTMNQILIEWYCLRQRELPLSFNGQLREIVNRHLEIIKETKSVAGMFSPCILLDVALSWLTNTTWAVARGFLATPSKLCVPSEVLEAARKHAFCWVNGKSDIIPIIGINLLGVKRGHFLSAAEHKWLANAEGRYELSMLARTTEIDVEARADWTETLPDFIFKTVFKGDKIMPTYVDGKILATYEVLSKAELEYNTQNVMGNDDVRWMYGQGPGPFEYKDKKGEADQQKKSETGMVNPEDVGPPPPKGARQEAGDVPLEFNGIVAHRLDETEKGLVGYGTKVGNASDPHRNAMPVLKGYEEGGFRSEWYISDIPIGSGLPNYGNWMQLTTHDKAPIPLGMKNNNAPGRDANFRYDVVQVRGDGACGLWSIIKDLMLRGVISTEGYQNLYNEIRSADNDRYWHCEDELAYMVASAGYGLMVYSYLTLPNGKEFNMIYAAGEKDAKHIIRLRVKGYSSDGGLIHGKHYELIVPHARGVHRVGRVPRRNHSISGLTPKEVLTTLRRPGFNRLPKLVLTEDMELRRNIPPCVRLKHRQTKAEGGGVSSKPPGPESSEKPPGGTTSGGGPRVHFGAGTRQGTGRPPPVGGWRPVSSQGFSGPGRGQPAGGVRSGNAEGTAPDDPPDGGAGSVASQVAMPGGLKKKKIMRPEWRVKAPGVSANPEEEGEEVGNIDPGPDVETGGGSKRSGYDM